MNVFNDWSRDVVHGLASVDAEASIGDGSRVWAYASIAAGAVLGKNVTVGQGAHIGKNVRVGNGCKIQNGAQLFEGVTLEDDVFIGPGVIFTNVLTPRAFVDRKTEFKPTLVKKGASIGANVTIVCGVTIGEYAMIGAGAVVTHDVAAHELRVGNPAVHVGFVCRCGERHSGDGLCTACGARLVAIYNKLWPQNIRSTKVADAKIP